MHISFLLILLFSSFPAAFSRLLSFFFTLSSSFSIFSPPFPSHMFFSVLFVPFPCYFSPFIDGIVCQSTVWEEIILSPNFLPFCSSSSFCSRSFIFLSDCCVSLSYFLLFLFRWRGKQKYFQDFNCLFFIVGCNVFYIFHFSHEKRNEIATLRQRTSTSSNSLAHHVLFFLMF